jgi:sec-independent protein translocase protein TatB
MFDFGLGSTELLLVAIVALIVIGPKDLPRLLRTMGQYMRKIQGMAREFQTHLNEAAKEAGVDDVKKEVKGMTNFTVTADLDKQGAEIKRAIESGAPKPPATPPNGADAGKPDGVRAQGRTGQDRGREAVGRGGSNDRGQGQTQGHGHGQAGRREQAQDRQAEGRGQAETRAQAEVQAQAED